MNIRFKWNNSLQAFPQSNTYILGEMKEFIQSTRGTNNFLSFFREALDSLPEENQEIKEDLLSVEFRKQIKTLFNTALTTKLRPIIEADTAAWDRFSTKKRYTKKIETTGTDGKKTHTKKDVTPKNQGNIDFIEDKTLADLRDLKVKDRLMKEGSLAYSNKNMPPFDFNEWLTGYDNDTSNDVQHMAQATEVEVWLRPDKKGEKYRYAHNKEFNVNDAHIVGYLPALEASRNRSDVQGDSKRAVEALIKAQGDWIAEITDIDVSEAFKAKREIHVMSSKEPVEYPIDIDLSKNKKLPPQTETLEGTTQSWQIELKEEEDGTFRHIGSKVYIDKEELGSWLRKVMQVDRAKAGGVNPKELFDENRYIDDDGKTYEFHIDPKSEQRGGEEALYEIELKWPLNDLDSTGNPYNFVSDKADLFKAILQQSLNDPLEVYTVKILGNITLTSIRTDTLGSKMKTANRRSPTEKNPNPEKYQLIKFKRTSGKSKPISEQQYNELTDNQKYIYVRKGKRKSGVLLAPMYDKLSPEKKKNYEKKDAYKMVYVNMTDEEIDIATSKAYKLKTDMSQTISDDEYHTLVSEEQKKYLPNVGLQILPHGEVEEEELKDKVSGGGNYKVLNRKRTPLVDQKTIRDFGSVNYSSGGLSPDEVQLSFKKAIIVTKFELIKHGEFDLKTLSRESANLPMKALVNRMSDNILALSNKLP